MIKIAVTIYLGMLLTVISARAAEPIRVAIVDSGVIDVTKYKLCPNSNRTNLKDEIGHGTEVADTITRYASNANYCLLLYKYFIDIKNVSADTYSTVAATKKALKDGAVIINMSYGGPDSSESELEVIRSHPNITFVAAAGNNGQDISKSQGWYFPASYNLPNVIVVGATDGQGRRLSSSNYGPYVTTYRQATCTSYAAARRTGELIKERSK